jgi:sec-independent protein translocase protein TatA
MSALPSPVVLGFIGNLGMPELMIIGLLALLIFGNRLPSVMRSLGVGITEFKKGIKGEVPTDSSGAITDHRDKT